MAVEAAIKSTTSRQLAYTKKLKAELGEAGRQLRNEMSSYEASKVISELVAKAQKNGQSKMVKVNEPRLGMAMKECFRLHTSLGRDIWEEKRKMFIERVIETYELYTEIAEKVAQSNFGSRRQPENKSIRGSNP